MTAPEMKDQFLQTLDRWAAIDAPSYEDEEISWVLTRAQENLIKRKYTPYGNRYRVGFEGDEKRTKELSNLVKGPYNSAGSPLAIKAADQTTAFNFTKLKGVIFDLPEDLMFTVHESAITTSQDECFDLEEDYDDDGEKEKLKEASVVPIGHDELNANFNNPFRRPNDGRVWRIDHSAELNSGPREIHELLTNGKYDIVRYLVRYVRYPKPIITEPISDPIQGVTAQTDCELDETIHTEIVQEAARIAASETQPDEYQLRTAEAQRTE